jgi:hypothetical protein
MVSYQKWTAIGYEVARSKGANLEGTGTQSANQELVSVLADIWNDRKSDLSTATVAEARNIARSEISIV